MAASSAASPAPPAAVHDLHGLILGAARDLLLAEGVDGLSMRKIAQKIGYSPTALYLHFPHKDAILHALLDEGVGMLHTALTDALAAAPDAPEAQMRALCQAYLGWGEANPARYEVMLLLHPRHMERYPPDKYRKARRALAVFAEVLRRAGFAPEEAALAAAAAWAQLHGAVALSLARRFDVRLDTARLREAVVESVVRGTLAVRP